MNQKQLNAISLLEKLEKDYSFQSKYMNDLKEIIINNHNLNFSDPTEIILVNLFKELDIVSFVNNISMFIIDIEKINNIINSNSFNEIEIEIATDFDDLSKNIFGAYFHLNSQMFKDVNQDMLNSLFNTNAISVLNEDEFHELTLNKARNYFKYVNTTNEGQEAFMCLLFDRLNYYKENPNSIAHRYDSPVIKAIYYNLNQKLQNDSLCKSKFFSMAIHNSFFNPNYFESLLDIFQLDKKDIDYFNKFYLIDNKHLHRVSFKKHFNMSLFKESFLSTNLLYKMLSQKNCYEYFENYINKEQLALESLDFLNSFSIKNKRQNFNIENLKEIVNLVKENHIENNDWANLKLFNNFLIDKDMFEENMFEEKEKSKIFFELYSFIKKDRDAVNVASEIDKNEFIIFFESFCASMKNLSGIYDFNDRLESFSNFILFLQDNYNIDQVEVDTYNQKFLNDYSFKNYLPSDEKRYSLSNPNDVAILLFHNNDSALDYNSCIHLNNFLTRNNLLENHVEYSDEIKEFLFNKQKECLELNIHSELQLINTLCSMGEKIEHTHIIKRRKF